MAKQYAQMLKPLSGEDSLLKLFLAVSVGVHLVVFMIEDISLWRVPSPIVEEWEMEADLFSDLDLGAPDKTALPKAEEAPEPAVPDNMLPQLTKKFAVQDKTVPEEGEETLDEQATPAEKENLDQEKAPVNIKQDDDEKNRLKMKDALKRLALEKLRKENKSDKMQAETSDPLAKIREELASRRKLNDSSMAGAVGDSNKRYRGLIQRAVRRHYAIPEAYNLKGANLVVIIAVVVNERGDLRKADIYQSSGDDVFDQLAFNAVKSAAPLPPPPQELAGEIIHLQFTPRSF